LRITFNESLFTVFLNGEKLFETEDRTFSKAGLCTKADSLTYFDEFIISVK